MSRNNSYGAYRFRGKDPAIGELEEVIGGTTSKDLTALHNSGGPSTSAMRGWFHGKTLSPKNATLEAAGRAAGYRRRWVKL